MIVVHGPIINMYKYMSLKLWWLITSYKAIKLKNSTQGCLKFTKTHIVIVINC